MRTAIVAHERFYGTYKGRKSVENIARVDALRFTALEFEKKGARRAGEIRATLAAAGNPIGPYDVLIAGHALVRFLTLVNPSTPTVSLLLPRNRPSSGPHRPDRPMETECA